MIERRTAFLTGYQNAAYAERYKTLVEKVRSAEPARCPGYHGLTAAVARYYFKLLAIKDEYEVARLFTGEEFHSKLTEQFEGDFKLSFHLAPPLIARRDPESGHLIKREFGPWMMTAYRLLAKLKGLRGTAFDPFGYSDERRLERQLIVDYENLVRELLEKLTPDNHGLAVELASIPEKIRGYGHIKEANIKTAQACQADLLAAFRNPDQRRSVAAE